ncbi:MAG: UDP-3-O-(3-hydroxymyristoyl)glucosamine N-acyltransferase [Gammaproteobacteria bacterium]|nr:UDP-3-O-(3-hydroxymyristoyl)glucosamine N-acyltransferase [Gammaproteobacteria bacterium]NNF50693.1 UDP-3-O-(3-hydroxymyristoyl)glucosamine N-acyltransferase [Woeseiaceae bacterium]MBT8093955.1 UDP-3-O-(3-hydroxymyristoyl)glucosamine N-acyltransferase [Gammaproteobacteria bacterium]MBT8106579.1 UDP-3-O-(3-hydroxymyristoyl)glucosamine N-acyltransferase [Gammaproteobacteria bacterium]NNK26594.1 UDP-3-O-(3-hydroxymyristoyl)glucosamine N-acyltransferase [Woeseiaceae bacterium]
MPVSLGELAVRFGCELVGDPDVEVSSVASLPNATRDSLTFLSSSAYKRQLSETQAAAVILRPADAGDCPVAAILHHDPYACYARMAAVIHPPPAFDAGIHPSAVVDASASIADSACIGPHVVIGERAIVGANVFLGPGTVVGPDCSIGDDCRFIASVTLARAVHMGRRCIMHPGVVLGADGFGNAMTPEGWVKVPQVGGVVIGDDVEIGANTTVDCGAIDDTVIEDGVRIDNLCMIAHNVRIGAHTAIAGQSGIAGSTTIGKRCMFAGSAGAVGHISICDDVVVLARAVVTRDITEPGSYSGLFPAESSRAWSKFVGRLRRLEALQSRVKKLEGK